MGKLKAFPVPMVLLLFACMLPCGVARAENGGGPSAADDSSTSLRANGGSIHSVVTEAEGYSCMGDDKSRKQAESASIQEAKRNAGETAATYIRSETNLKDGMLEKDLLSAYASAQVRILQELAKEWYKDPALGDCHRVRIRAEVVPDQKAMAAMSAQGSGAWDGDPTAPLTVRVWTDRPRYVEGECVRLYLKGNKPFYGRVVYQQADDTLVQLLPNPYRQSSHFEGGTVYELPSAEDRFTMDTCAPFGTERVTVYASTAPGGDPEVEAADKVYLVKTSVADLPVATRGIRLAPSLGAKRPSAAEFAEASAELRTGKK